MTRPASLRFRLLFWLVLATACIGVLALIDTRAEALRTARDVSDRVLAGAALAIAERVSVDAEGGAQVAIPFSALDMLSSAAQDQVFYRVDGPGGLLTGYEELTPAENGFADGEIGGVAIRKATVRRELTTGEGSFVVTVTVAESTRAREALARAILTRSALRLVLLIGGAAVVAALAATLALRPARQLSQTIAERAAGDLGAIVVKAPAELMPVVEALNGFLLRLHKALAALQSFAGNANHQIRTPLTVARTQMALARRATTPEASRAALAKADAALIRAERVLAQLLVLARLGAEGAGPKLVPADLVQVARQVTEELLPDALRAGHDLGFEGPDGVVTVETEPVLLGEALRNLITNALYHTPPGTEITVRVEEDGVLAVQDNGPALPAPLLAELTQRLQPDTGAAPVRIAQHGLGLIIVRDIATALNGFVRLKSGPDGRGLMVRLKVG
ncbi:sensor histidine kinase [Neogemmobacter tilapiae]|uniref:histidine kinase n=1 Tax=Neogemmobacter tilapiae TaxID=875041 RepID=A0A918WM42_9RHOB|nr:sensor histidine kinase [Gemmobacter tilapiae]GHC59482.1 histidine kinase [Gemmobacter tilapiae]